MANDENKQSGTNGFTGLWAVLVLFFSAVLVDYAPLKTSRPHPEETLEFSSTGVKARLWQDPFTAVQREGAKPQMELRKGMCSNELPGEVLKHMIENKDAEIIMPLGAMIQEANWESVEELQGRRQRYAVLAALNRLGYAPVNPDKLQCLEISDNNAYENSSAISMAENQSTLGIPKAENRKPMIVPYELFRKEGTNAKKTQVVLFWLNETAFNHKPLEEIRRLFGAAPPDIGKVRIVGPWASDTVRDLVVEAQQADHCAVTDTLSLLPRNRLMFFSSSATAADEFLLPAGQQDQTTLTEFLANLHGKEDAECQSIFFERLTITDNKVVRSLAEELARRGLDQKSLKADHAYVALISEWDTLYAQTLPLTFKRVFDIEEQCKDSGKGCPILQFTYLRGLDGLLPGKRDSNSDRQGKNTKESGENGASIERPEGDAQIDYLRRLTDRLYDQEQRLRDQGKELKAIGVFGNDVYDKLLVLKALRFRFPGKVLFTTDLDAAYLHPDEFKSVTHNLIVASAFGLTLNSNLQGSIPPFRDSYQTGTFLATQLALSMNQFQATIEKPDQRLEVHKKISEWFTKSGPRVFEIGRTRAVSLNDPWDGQSEPCQSIADCQSVHPASGFNSGESSYHRDKLFHLTKLYAGSLLLLIVFWLLLYLLSQGARQISRKAWRWLRYHPMIAVIGFAGLLAIMATINYLAFFTKGMELLSWVDGVSMWPAELIRLATLLLAFVLFRRGTLLIQWNNFVVSRRFFPDTWRIAMDARTPAKPSLSEAIKNYWQELLQSDRFEPQSPLEIWSEHIHPRGAWAELIRALVPALVFVVFGVILLNLIGPPERPYRGDLFGKLDFVILFLTLIAVQILIFFVAGVTARSNRMAQQLKKASTWPSATLADLKLINDPSMEYDDMNFQGTRCGSIFDPLLDMHLVADRTEVLSGLIYYPFVALALFIGSRTPLFDNWNIPWQLGLLFFLSFTIPIVCALRLRNNAEDLRSSALERLSLCVLAQKGSDNPKLLAQLEEAIKQVKFMEKGAFRPFTQQPWLKALFLPISSWSGFTILQFLITTNL